MLFYDIYSKLEISMHKVGLFSGKTGDFEAVIGLEVHAQMVSRSKLFSGASTALCNEPNENVAFVDAAFPGMLPVLNGFCIEQGIRTGLGLKGKVNLKSVFERKNYFYPDLPAGYQISQYEFPLIEGGELSILGSSGEERKIRIERLHLEQDAGKNLHEIDKEWSYIDLNRAGITLMEIVSAPDLRTPEEVIVYLKKLRSLLRYLGTSEANMEQGNLRADVNISVRCPGEPLGTRVELKNMNSFRFIQQALYYEIERQIGVIESGGTIIQETRLFDVHKGETRPMRSKEDAHDYRYFPDPDLYPVILKQNLIDKIASTLPELPDSKKQRFMEQMELSAYDASILVEEKEIAEFFEHVVQALPSVDSKYCKLAANWIMGELFSYLKRYQLGLEECKILPIHISEIVVCCAKGELSNTLAKEVFGYVWESGKAPKVIMEEKGLLQVSNESDLLPIIEKTLEKESKQVEAYLGGKEKIFGYLVGQVMKETKGKGNPQLIQKLVREVLQRLRS